MTGSQINRSAWPCHLATEAGPGCPGGVITKSLPRQPAFSHRPFRQARIGQRVAYRACVWRMAASAQCAAANKAGPALQP